MPVAQFPGGRNWGYDGVHPYAVQNTYGGPHGLQRLVDACHARGLAVILDVVYNHLGPEGNYLGEFGPYFTSRYNTPWGKAINYDDSGCDPVRDFVLDNVRLWIESTASTACGSTRSTPSTTPVARSHLAVDQGDVPTRRPPSARRAVVIAESDLNDVRLLHAAGARRLRPRRRSGATTSTTPSTPS